MGDINADKTDAGQAQSRQDGTDNADLAVEGPRVPETPSWPEDPPEDWLTYHLCHPGPGYAFDPNAALYYKGRYHLHYIYDYPTRQTGHCIVYAHVSSCDMVHWQWHPTVLAPKVTGHGMFSGTGFLTREGKPAVIYHGVGSGRNWLVHALDDRLDEWTTPEAVEPRTEDGQEPEMVHWDPDCWLMGETYYAISGGANPTLMKSADLKHWTHLGPLLHDDYPADLGVPREEDISCANMLKIGNKWMLLCISHSLGCRYYLGEFKDEKYLPESHAMMSWNGEQYFAPESLLTKDGRRVMWAWLVHMQEDLPEKGWPIAPKGVQSLPRELDLPDDGVLRIRPLRELESLRHDRTSKTGVTVSANSTHELKDMAGNALELEVVFKTPSAPQFGLDVLCNKTGEAGVRIAVDAESKTLKVGPVNAPFSLPDDEDLRLRVFIDKNLVEVFANDRQAAAHAIVYDPASTRTRLFAEGGAVNVKTATAWKMKSTCEGDTVFRGTP